MITQHIQVQTKAGYAKITLNHGKLLITYFVHHLSVDYAIVPLEDAAYLYRDGWNLDNLKKVVRQLEPITIFHSK